MPQYLDVDERKKMSIEDVWQKRLLIGDSLFGKKTF